MTGYNSESSSSIHHINNLKEKNSDKIKSDQEKRTKFRIEEELNLDLYLKIKLTNITELDSNRDIEYDYGNREYKLKICDLTEMRIEELATQMKFRLEEGCGECFYEIGVEDNGNPLGLPLEELEQSVENIKLIVSKLNATADIIKIYQGRNGLIAEVMIKVKEEIQRDKIEIKIGLLGGEGSGKSTLVYIFNNIP